MPLNNRVWSAGRLFVIAACLVATYLLFAVTAMRVALTRARSARARFAQPHGGRSDRADAGSRSRAGRRRNRPARSEDSRRTHRASGTCAGHDYAASTQRSRLGEPGTENHRDPRTDRRKRARGAAAAAAGWPDRGALAEVRSADLPGGTVIAQEPAASARGTEVALLVNRGERSHYYVMPDLIGVTGRAPSICCARAVSA